MTSISNQIENYIKIALDRSANGVLEFSRNDLALYFNCVPSQINYVLETRFREDAGYHVESKRGGGGYVKIIKLDLMDDNDLLALLKESGDNAISQISAERLLSRLADEEFITKREALILSAIMDNSSLQLDRENADIIRGRILKTLLVSLLREDF